jgi:nitric oxide reductase subunit B
MPHGHVALLGAFGYISIAFLYLTSRANALANNYVWNDKLSKIGFWTLTAGALLFTIPTYIIGIYQSEVAMEAGYFTARLRETVDVMQGWMWARTVPDGLMILGGLIIFFDLAQKTFFAKKTNN